MDKFDWFIKKQLRVEYYFRYADDFIIVHPDSLYLKEIIGPIKNFLSNKLGLELHPQKIQIRKFSQGIDFLGYIILPYYILLRTKTKRRMLKKISQKYEYLQKGLISGESFNQSLQSYLGMLKHCKGYGIVKKIEELTFNFWFNYYASKKFSPLTMHPM